MLKRYLNSLNFFQLQETQETTNQVRQSAERLSSKIKQTRDELEGDLQDTRDVVKDLKDFLSGKDCFSAEVRWGGGVDVWKQVHLVSVMMTE